MGGNISIRNTSVGLNKKLDMKGLSAIYRAAVSVGDSVVPARFADTWNHPAGPKTIFFWAPSFKWALVIAGIGDIARPPEKLSLFQSGALAATGIIWARYSLVIIPKNYNLFFVNIFVGATGLLQLSRIYTYRQSIKNIDSELQK